MEKTFVMLKPDALQRNLIGKIIQRFEEKGLKLVAIKMMQLDDKMLDVHYRQYLTKGFFPKLKQFMKSYPVVATVWEGKDAIRVVRTLVGATNGREAAPGTIRGDLGMSISCNMIHASDAPETAKEEIERFFSANEIMAWDSIAFKLQYSEDEM